jgi:tetratricopeptide (TPR) repeat protein
MYMPVSGALLLALVFAPPQDYLAEGVKSLDANQPAIAEPLLRKAAEAEPKDVSAHFNLALALSLQHKDPEAIAEYRRALELKPALYEADLNLGILLLRDKRPAEALPVLKEAAETRPADVKPNLYYAQALLDSGDAAHAEQHYAAVIAADPNAAAAKSGLARALLQQSKLAEAAAVFRAVNDKDGLLEVGTRYEKAGQIPEAIAIYKEFPGNAEVREHLAQLELNNKLALADTYRSEKQTSKMLEQLQSAVASEPNYFDLRMALGRALRDSHNLPAAAQQFFAATKLKPDAVPAWNELASALIVSENYAQGLAALDRIHALGKEIPGDYFLRAITLDKLKQRPQALSAYQQFLSADNGAHPDQDFQARQRMRIIESELKK